MQGVDARLGARKSKPGERIEEIVQVLRPGCDASGLVDAYLVITVVCAGRDERHLPAGLGSHARFFGKTVERAEIGLACLQTVEPRP
jgi:hypothetical protein